MSKPLVPLNFEWAMLRTFLNMVQFQEGYNPDMALVLASDKNTHELVGVFTPDFKGNFYSDSYQSTFEKSFSESFADWNHSYMSYRVLYNITSDVLHLPVLA